MEQAAIDFTHHLALIIECEEKQDGSIQHEWSMKNKNEAVKLANYLRNHGYQVKNETIVIKSLGNLPIYYVGVPFESLKKP